ncbi:LysR family transcriptional regulator, partial [Neptunomonas sp.]|uniref:LysR family transcriptional regulator n=1 Tax=Neptunomonas sp. TaxID=1971898 RepID=UPI003561B522
MIDYKQLKALSTVLEEKNFERAAKRLHVTQSAVSQRIKQLEEMVGQTLLIRSHPIIPTPAGQTLLKHFRQIEMLQNEVMSELNPVLKSGHIRLSIGVNADSLSTWFLPAIDPILKQHNV